MFCFVYVILIYFHGPLSKDKISHIKIETKILFPLSIYLIIDKKSHKTIRMGLKEDKNKASIRLDTAANNVCVTTKENGLQMTDKITSTTTSQDSMDD